MFSTLHANGQPLLKDKFKPKQYACSITNIADIKHAFYINLDERTDRKAYVEEQLASVGLDQVVQRFKATKNEHGALGCSLSHYKCLMNAIVNGWDHVLICEDDITFTNPALFVNQLNKCLSKPQLKWDVIMLAGNNAAPYTVIDDSCVKINRCITTTGYLVNKHYMRILADNIKEGATLFMKNPTLGIQYAVDTYFAHLQHKDMWLLITPLTVTQQEGYSDIEQKHTNYARLMLNLDKPYFSYL
jgi:glycosyl transferase family 25